MTSPFRRIFCVSIASLGLSACATHSEKENLTEKVAQQVQVKDRRDLSTESRRLIEDSSALTSVQKSSLLALRDATQMQMDQMQKESVKLRAVLIEDVMATNYNAREVNLIKNQISKLEKKRVAVIFKTVDRANAIIGRAEIQNKRELFEGLLPADRQRGEF